MSTKAITEGEATGLLKGWLKSEFQIGLAVSHQNQITTLYSGKLDSVGDSEIHVKSAAADHFINPKTFDEFLSYDDQVFRIIQMKNKGNPLYSARSVYFVTSTTGKLDPTTLPFTSFIPQ